jgi:hypothetical protein
LNWSEIDLLAIVNSFGLTTFGQTALSRVGRNDSARIKRIYYSRLFYQKVHHYNYVKTKIMYENIKNARLGQSAWLEKR